MNSFHVCTLYIPIFYCKKSPPKQKTMVESCPNIIGNLNSSKFVNCLFLESVHSKCVLDWDFKFHSAITLCYKIRGSSWLHFSSVLLSPYVTSKLYLKHFFFFFFSNGLMSNAWISTKFGVVLSRKVDFLCKISDHKVQADELW